MCSPAAPPPPDYTPIADAAAATAERNYQLSREQFEWAKETYADNKEIVDRVVNTALTRQAELDAQAKKDRTRYETKFQPLEDQLVSDAQSYMSPERAALEASRAGATVAQQFDAQRRAASQALGSFGVDPSSLRYAALDSAMRTQQAAAQAGAENQSRVNTEATGRALRSEAINVGRGYPGQAAVDRSTAMQSGNAGVNSALGLTASGANSMGTGTQWAGAGNQALGAWTGALSAGYDSQMSQFNANQQASSGLGTLAGSLLGAAGNAGGFAALFAEGGAVPETPGGPVPQTASPTAGAVVDDVPARLTAGEFVVPLDVVRWKGEEFFQRTIDGARRARQSAPAKPSFSVEPRQAPTFASRPAAIPMG